MYNDYSRYQNLKKESGYQEQMPLVQISISGSDKYELWKENKSRYDILSLKYYGNPFYDFLIHYANPNYISQFDIPSNELIRIPFPLERAIGEYESSLKK